MKRILILFALLLFGVTAYAQSARTAYVAKNGTYRNVPITAADTINESETYFLVFQNFQNYPAMQDVQFTGSAVTGSGDIVVTLYGKKFSADTYSSLGNVTWDSSADTTFTISVTTANRYRFWKLEFVSDATDKQVLLTNVQFKNWFTGGEFSTTSLNLSGTLTVAEATALNGTVALGNATTDVTTLNGSITSNQTLAAAATPFYFRTTLTATSGDHNNARFRGQSAAVGASTAEVRGLYAQGVTNAAGFGGTVTSIYANSIAKATSTTVTLRGMLIDTETEGTPTLLTNMYGLYIRNKSTIAIGGDNYSMVIDNEKMGTGIVQDAAIQIKTTTWGAGIEAFTYGIDMNMTGAFGTADIRFQNGETLSNATDGVLDVGAAAVQASLYNFADATAVAGAADAITIDFTADITVATGTMITFVAEAAVTGAATLNVDGAGALAINKYNGAKGAISANDIRSGQVVTVVFDGALWVIMSPIGN